VPEEWGGTAWAGFFFAGDPSAGPVSTIASYDVDGGAAQPERFFGAGEFWTILCIPGEDPSSCDPNYLTYYGLWSYDRHTAFGVQGRSIVRLIRVDGLGLYGTLLGCSDAPPFLMSFEGPRTPVISIAPTFRTAPIQSTIDIIADIDAPSYDLHWALDQGQYYFLTDGLQSDGSVVTGAQTRHLTVVHPAPSPYSDQSGPYLTTRYRLYDFDYCQDVESSIVTYRLSRCTADFNRDGDSATDADIEKFFACLAGNCCPTCDGPDFNGDGDDATDADIESFFRVLAGGSC
jgi:hypothetical protein